MEYMLACHQAEFLLGLVVIQTDQALEDRFQYVG